MLLGAGVIFLRGGIARKGGREGSKLDVGGKLDLCVRGRKIRRNAGFQIEDLGGKIDLGLRLFG